MMFSAISNLKAASCVVGVLSLGVVQGCELMQGEGLRTLADTAKSEQEKETILKQEEQSFQSLRSALGQGVLPPGTSKEEIVRAYGPPVVEIREENGIKWLYKSRYGSWFNAPKAALYLDKKGRLDHWECSPEDICRSIELKQEVGRIG